MLLGRRILSVLVAAIAAASLVVVSSAQADFHFIKIREVYPGGAANSSYVVLQMYAAGQTNLAPSHHIDVYDASGNSITTFPFVSDVGNGQSQATVLVADTGYATAFPSGPTPDATHAGLDIPASGGAACFDAPDCVAWGNFSSGVLPSPVGQPAAPGGIPAGMALRRSIVPGCPTLLENGDDSNDSAADFSLVFPNPRPNSAPPPERSCDGSAGPGAVGNPGGDNRKGAPQTRLRRRPSQRTRDRTPTFGFAADEQVMRFECRLDRKPFKPCRSPFTTRRLALGRHTFAVRARDLSGQADPTPAVDTFRVLRRQRP